MNITVKSSSFKDGETIPSMYTCDGENISPHLVWSDPPAGTKSIAVIVDDPDASMGAWVHWVVYNIPPGTRELPEKIPHGATLPNGAFQGVTDFGYDGYGGPCPPSGTHRYYFKVYALDTDFVSGAGKSKKQLADSMKGHILAQGQILGRYKRSR